MMASQSGNNDAGSSGQGISSELRARDLPSKRLLGKGLASIVYETEWNGERFARKDFIGVRSGAFQKEAAILVGLKDHENVVKTHGRTVDEMSCSLVLEYMEEDLLDLLQKRKESQGGASGTASGSRCEGKPFYPFELAEALAILSQIARGMEFLHEQNIPHGDLKTKNILVSHINDGDKNVLSVKVADFGLVRTKSKSMSFVSRQARKLDVVQWKAPEVLKRLLSEDNDVTSSESDSNSDTECTGSLDVNDRLGADVYSFAVTCSQILTGECPYPHENWKELKPKIVSGELRPNLPAACPGLLKCLLESCWTTSLADRPKFSSIRERLEWLVDAESSEHTPQTMAPENGSSNGTAMGTPEYMAAQPKLSKQHSRKSLASFIRHRQPNFSSKRTSQTMAPENGSSSGTAMGPPEYMAAQPKLSKQHSRRSLASFIRHGQPNLVRATFDKMKKMTWQQKLSMVFVAILWRSGKLLKLLGFIVEWTLNLLLLNNGLLRLLWKLLIFKWGEVVIPKEGTEKYLSLIGQLDRRFILFVNTSQSAQADSTRADTAVFPADNVGALSTADVCIMAAKLAYENPAVVQKAVVKDWKMHFVKFYNCWNEYQQMWNTQAFVFMDKSHDANAVVVSFRGTEPFNAHDWSTDLDFSWVKLEGLGGVHLGFLEALGLATRDSVDTFVNLRNNAIAAKQHMEQIEHKEAMAAPPVPPSPHHKTKPEIINTMATSGLPDYIVTDDSKLLAYDDITKQVALLLHDNPKAKLFITGHSLGGALAALYATMLNYTGETEIASKIGAVYTFGQPKVGDADFAEYASEHLAGKYFRVVYCNDVVPRVPFDNDLFAFKHFGNCDYFNSVYDGFTLFEEPNPNSFGIARSLTMHLNALWELRQGGGLIASQHGEEFKDNELGMIARMAGVLVPGVASHNPCNYVNSVRLGPLRLAARLKGDIAGLPEELHLMQDNLKDIVYILLTNLPQLPGMDVVRFAAQRLFQ